MGKKWFLPVILVGVASPAIRDAIANNRKITILGGRPCFDSRDEIPFIEVSQNLKRQGHRLTSVQLSSRPGQSNLPLRPGSLPLTTSSFDFQDD